MTYIWTNLKARSKFERISRWRNLKWFEKCQVRLVTPSSAVPYSKIQIINNIVLIWKVTLLPLTQTFVVYFYLFVIFTRKRLFKIQNKPKFQNYLSLYSSELWMFLWLLSHKRRPQSVRGRLSVPVLKSYWTMNILLKWTMMFSIMNGNNFVGKMV